MKRIGWPPGERVGKQSAYSQAGVNVDVADEAKKEMGKQLETADRRVLNRVGAFASLFEAKFDGIREPVLVLKAEEPGSKQLLAFQHDRVEGVCFDLVNHLINDVVVMGAKPEVMLDIILCGKFEKDIVLRVVAAIAQACSAQGCSLLGGETSEQPRVLPAGGYMLNASAVGVVEKSRIIDGSKIQTGNRVVALASNGLHTNGYSLVRKLMEEHPAFLEGQIGGESVLDVILRPHYCYYPVLKTLFPEDILLGLAHITGGGIEGNLDRILPEGTAALIDLSQIRVPEIFARIRQFGSVEDADMLRTFNLGVGLAAVVRPEDVSRLVRRSAEFGLDAYDIGEIVAGGQNVRFRGALSW